MSSRNPFRDAEAEMLRQRQERTDAVQAEVSLLPPDLTGHVFLRAREEGEKIRDRMQAIDQETAVLDEQIVEARKAAKNLYQPILRTTRYRGDILGDFTPGRVEPVPGAFLKGEAALKVERERVRPLLAKRKALANERFALEQQYSQLKRIALAASRGEVSLLHHLTEQWESVLDVSVGGLRAKLLGHNGVRVANTDRFGNPLPVEAQDGLPPAGRIPQQ